MDAKVACTLRAALHIILTLQQVGGYTYRNQRRFTEDIDWSYAGTLNQNNWAKKYPWCSSAKQSPIDVEENLAQVKLQYQKLRLDGWDNLTGQRTAINNDGKTVALDVDGDFYVSGGGLGSKFKAGRITFHWGRCNASSSEGSEHSLDGVKYPLEMQIYCFEPQRFDSFQQSVKAGGRITALAVLFEASSEEDNANFATIIDAINSVSRYGKSAPVSPFTPRTLLPNSTDKYFIYNGSLTTPPCSETVEWIVFKNTVCISPDQLEVFCEVMTMQQAGYVMLMDYLQNNYREQQRNFMGQVFSSYTGTEELLTPACSSEPEKAEVTAYNASSLLVTWERPRAVYDSAIERYSVSYKMADAQDAAAAEYLTDGDQDVGAILDDLLANASYVVRVVAVCANGLYGRVSDPLTFTVPADGPGNSLIPDSNPFDYEEETSPPDPSLNESVQEEDYDQAWITTKAPASSTWGPHRRPPQQDVAAPETQSTTVAASSSQRTSSSRPPGASTTPLYANARDRQGGVEPKSSENTKADLNLTLTTVSSSWMNGGIGLPLNHTTTTTATSATSKTVTRPVTTTMKTTEPTNKTAMNGDTALAADASRNETTTATRPMSKTTTIKKTMELTPYSTANKTVTTSKTTSNMTKTMATTAYTTTKNTTATNPPTNKTTSMTRPVTNTMNRTTGMTTSPTANKTMTRPMNKTTTMTPPTNKTTSVTSPLANSTNKTTTMKTTMELTTNSTANKTTTRTLPTNKTATMTGPLNKTTTMNPATNKNTTVTRPLTTTTNKTTTMNTTKEMTTNPLTTPTNKNATMNTKIATMTTNKTTTINTTMVSTNTTSNKMVTSNQPMNKTPTETETMNKTLTMTKTKTPTTNLTHLSDHSITPSSVHTDPYEGPTIPETDYENGLPDEAGVPIQDGPRGKSPPRGPTTPSIPHFPTTRTWVWRSGVVLQTTPPFSKGERLSVLPPPSSPSSLLYDVTAPHPSSWPAPSARLHELTPSSSLDSALLPGPIPASPQPHHAPSFADDLVSFSSGDRGEVAELGASLPEVSLSLSPTLGPGHHAGTAPLPRHHHPAFRPALSFADNLASFSSGEPVEVSEWGVSLSEVSASLSPTLRPSVLFTRDFPLSAATPGLTPSFSNEVEVLGYGTGSTPDSFLPEVGDGGFSDAICGCSLEPSVSWPHASPRVPLGATTSGVGLDLFASSSGVLVGSFSGAASGGLVVLLSPSSPTSPSPPATHSAPALTVAASASEHASSPSLASVLTTPATADASNGASGSDVDQEWDGVQVSASGEGTLLRSTGPPSATLESGQTPVDLDDHSSVFYFDSGSGSTTGSGRPAVPSPSPREEGGSGPAENLYDNDASSDFSIPEPTQRDWEKEEEEPVADVSDSSHESRVGSIGDGERKALVPLAVISTLTALGLVVLIGILIYWRLCFQTAHFYVDESSSPRVADTSAFASGNLAGNSPAKIKVLQKDISLPVCLPDEKAALPVQDFVRHVAELHRSDGFQRKFQEVQACTSDAAMTSETSNHPDNRSKNRYSNILAFDHSRVRLSTTDKDGCGGDYINANFVDGYKMRDAYIAAQGPLKSSTDDFWRMIWQHNVGVIVMITNLLENGRRKCEQYWPTDTCEDYGGLLVALKSVHELAHYTERTFTVTSTQVKKGSQRRRGQERVVTQYHYTQWPDMGVPDHALPLLGFIRQSSRARTANMGPVVVHCSAGVGRTGAYLVLDSMLRQMRQEDAVDVDGFLRHVRTQRNYLVQTQEQYVFIHDALVEAILCGDTEVAASRLHAYVERLLTPRRDGGATLDRQLQQLLNADATNDDASALHDDNRQKNRSGSLLPAERSRVRLSPCAGETSDYINASYVMGYRHCKEFIVTQNPLPGTVKDFWRMIWEHNVRVIVSLPGPAPAQDEDEEEAEPCVFWPGKGEPISCATLTVAQTCENVICLANEDTLAVHHLTVQAAHDDFVAEVRLYRAPRWPNPDGAISDTFLLLRLLRDQTAAKEGAAVILDRVGGVTAGTFCALSSLIGQLDHRRRVDVFRAARMSNLARPGTFRTRDRLSFLYEALLSVLDEPRDDDDDDHDDDERQSREERRPRRRSSGAAGQERNGAPALPGGRGSPGGLESLV
ncbi:receptor-type tyrosine-protein phosphatase zeta-like isoform X3 [Festucalex cinctus]